MRILRPIVLPQALLMVAGKPEMLEGSAVGAQLVGRHSRRREALLAEQLAHQLDGRRPVSTTLDQDLEDLALVVDGTPQVHGLARDPDDHFVEMPAIARSRTAPSQAPTDRRGVVKLNNHRANRAWFDVRIPTIPDQDTTVPGVQNVNLTKPLDSIQRRQTAHRLAADGNPH